MYTYTYVPPALCLGTPDAETMRDEVSVSLEEKCVEKEENFQN